jgi:hypothetical protein
MKQLRERGIYLAPDGQSFVASRLRQTTADGRLIWSRIRSGVACFLFNRYQWAFHGRPDYAVSEGGKLLPLDQPLSWCVDQLIDTGATAGAH